MSGLLGIGMISYAGFAQIGYGESLYRTLMILLTRDDRFGFEDPNSRALNIILIICSYLIAGYLLKWFAEYIIGLRDHLRKRTMNSKIAKMRDHYIVCGLGRVGTQVARELAHEGVPFVALDRDETLIRDAIRHGYVAVAKDSTEEGVLEAVGVDRAKALVACLGEDSLNLFVTLAARSLNPNLYIVARANRQDSELKLKRAGADRVALPYQIGGYHMANMAIRPNVVDYIDVVRSSHGTNDLGVEEMVVGDESRLAGHRLGKGLAEGRVGATVIAINGADGVSRVRPNGEEVIYPGDRLIMLGAKKDLTEASALIR